MQLLDGKALYYAFMSGANAVIQEKDFLNKINVFPIADGDTGSNLTSTMTDIIEEATIFDSAKLTLNSISDAALTGARGNSGIIFAQFIMGINLGIGDEDHISVPAFAQAVKGAVPFAYGAVANPTEGTILTVMHDWAESLSMLNQRALKFEDLLSQSIGVAYKSVQETPNKLAVLKKNSVVDSGAKGFLLFLQGFQHFIEKGKVEDLSAIAEDYLPLADHPGHLDVNLKFRYCTEVLLGGENLPISEIKAASEGFGDSLIVAGSGQRVRVHIHTNQPQELLLSLRGYGKIMQQKVDDMKKQNEVVYHRKHQIALVTDSIADLPQEIIDEEQIQVISLNLLIEGASYLDKLTITADGIFELLKTLDQYPTSSQPNGKSVEKLLSFLTSHYDSVLVVTVSKELSGTFQTVSKAAEMFLPQGKKITVIDSRLNSGAQGLLVAWAVKAIKAGKDHDEVVQWIEATIPKTKIFVSVHTLANMLRSGRISSVTAFAAKMLNLKPVVSLDEKGKGASLARPSVPGVIPS